MPDDDYRSALEDARDDYVVSFLRRHRWGRTRATRAINFSLLALLAIISTAIWQASGYSNDIFMVSAVVGYVLAFGLWIRDWLIERLYKEEIPTF